MFVLLVVTGDEDNKMLIDFPHRNRVKIAPILLRRSARQRLQRLMSLPRKKKKRRRMKRKRKRKKRRSE